MNMDNIIKIAAEIATIVTRQADLQQKKDELTTLLRSEIRPSTSQETEPEPEPEPEPKRKNTSNRITYKQGERPMRRRPNGEMEYQYRAQFYRQIAVDLSVGTDGKITGSSGKWRWCIYLTKDELELVKMAANEKRAGYPSCRGSQ